MGSRSEAARKAWVTRRGGGGSSRASASGRLKGLAKGSLNRHNQMNYLYNRGFLSKKHYTAYSKSQTGKADYKRAFSKEKGRLTWKGGRQIN